ncbi:MAG: efflux RND transporter permease subunit, partial [Acidobacteriota bacterium]
MDLTRTALKNPAGVGVAAAIVVFFGLFSLSRLPIQLFPEIEQPQMSISTSWRAASPLEVEAEILEPQEEVLQGLPGLERMTA